ncbi:MAG: FG-GAP repeat domain-containing protein, partial [Woeseiaceae bacterium]
IRRGYDRAAAYRPARIASADGRALISVRGNSLLSFDFRKQNNSPVLNTTPLPLGLSDEFEIESFYNGYDNVDQSEIVLREPELLRDINGDSLPDLITLETRSTGVFDKESTYRIHNGRSSPSGVAFLAEPDSVLSSRGFQFGLRAEKVDSANTMLISPGVKIGIRTIVGALFSKSVTLQIAIYAPDDDGVVAAEPSTTVRTKISFDFSSGQAEFPTIEFGDIDGDGLNDLVLKRRSDQLVWRRNLGNNQFDSSNQELAIQAPADGSAVVASDLNGDGRAEIVVRYARADSESLNRLVRFTTGAMEP